MVKYNLKYFVNGVEKIRPIKVVDTLSYSAPQAIVKKESVGGNGGLVVNTGRLLKTITLSGMFLNTVKTVQVFGATSTVVFVQETWNDVKKEIEKIKEKGYTIILETPLESTDADKYIIEDFTCDVTKGNETSLPFTIKVVEDRQANVRTNIINLVSIGAKDAFTARYLSSLQGAN